MEVLRACVRANPNQHHHLARTEDLLAEEWVRSRRTIATVLHDQYSAAAVFRLRIQKILPHASAGNVAVTSLDGPNPEAQGERRPSRTAKPSGTE